MLNIGWFGWSSRERRRGISPLPRRRWTPARSSDQDVSCRNVGGLCRVVRRGERGGDPNRRNDDGSRRSIAGRGERREGGSMLDALDTHSTRLAEERPDPPGLRLRLLGGFAAWVDGSPVDDAAWSRRKVSR